MSVVVDEFVDGEMRASGEVEYGVAALECGHYRTGPERPVGAAPGAPYAGVRGFRTYRDFVRRHTHATETDL